MWIYEKKLQFPVNIRKPNPAFAKVIITQLGGPKIKSYQNIFTFKKPLFIRIYVASAFNKGFFFTRFRLAISWLKLYTTL